MDKGILYIVSTPIGNMGDITLRAIETLKNVDMIAAEDTRQTLKLLSALEIKNRLVSYHKYSPKERVTFLTEQLQEGKSIALVTDAGTPIVSDPGDSLVEAAVEQGIEVVPIPGACAAISALTVAALPSDKFIFEGFLPKDKNRKAAIERLCKNPYTSILYESPHQLLKTLSELSILMGERRCAVCRELTKLYEQTLRTTVNGAYDYFSQHPPRGEFVLVIEGATEQETEIDDHVIRQALEQCIETGMRKKEAVAEISKKLNVPKNRVYKVSLEI